MKSHSSLLLSTLIYICVAGTLFLLQDMHYYYVFKLVLGCYHSYISDLRKYKMAIKELFSVSNNSEIWLIFLTHFEMNI